MKGAPGLLIAVGLGIAGAFCNWLYLANKGNELEIIEFIAIADDVRINPGDKFNEVHFMKLKIPKNAAMAGNLDKVAIYWKDRATVVGEPATKSYSPGELLLQKQIRTPPEMDIKKLLMADEVAVCIPVDTRTFVPALVNAGDQVKFIVPRLTLAAPAADADEAAEKRASASTELIGPFRILALGNRLGSQEVLRAAGVTASQENVMTVALKMVGSDFDEKGQKIIDNLRATNSQQVQVVLLPAPDAAKAK